MRYRLLEDQLEIYDKYEVSWCIWLYKDLGLQALLYQPESTAWMQRIRPILEKKERLGADAWGTLDTGIRDVMKPVEDLLARDFPDYEPFPFGAKRTARRLVRHILISEALLDELGRLFQGLSEEEVVELAESFNSERYRHRLQLERILSEQSR
jgi:hypothetical protein